MQTVLTMQARAVSVKITLALPIAWIMAVAAMAGPPPISFEYSFNPKSRNLQTLPAERHGLFHAGDEIQIATKDKTPIRILSLRGEIKYRGAPTKLRLPPGHYFVETPGDRTQFAVLPADFARCNLIGVHGTGIWNVMDDLNAALAPAWERCGRGTWETVCPRPGEWNWEQMDKALPAIRAAKRRVIYIAAGTVPKWVTDENLITAYSEFVTATLRRYPKDIYAWEVWNEPNRETLRTGRDWDAVAPRYLELARAAKTVRDKIAPGVKLLGPSWNSLLWPATSMKWLRSHDIEQALDIWSWHDYDSRQEAPDHPSMAHRVENVFGSEHLNKPAVLGELGLFGASALGCPAPRADDPPEYRSGLSWQRGYCRAIKLVVMNCAAGADVIIPHVGGLFAAVPNSNWEIYGFDYSPPGEPFQPRGPHPKTSAFLMTAYWLDGAKLISQRVIEGKIHLYEWCRRDGRRLVVAWCGEGGSVSLRPLPAAAVRDVYGQTWIATELDEEPVLFDFPAGKASALDAVASVLGR